MLFRTSIAYNNCKRTVPNIFVNKKHVGGCDNTLAAIASGEFQKMLKA